MSTPNTRSGILETVKQYGTRLYRFIRGRVENDADAEDILQDVWYQLSNISEQSSIEQLSGWLYRVARNKITDRQRRKKELSLDELVYGDMDENGEMTLADLLAVVEANAENDIMKKLFWEQLFLALEELPEAQRDAFVQNELEDRTLQEIADQTATSLKTVISRKRYAVQHLRRRLADFYQEFLEDEPYY